MYTHAQSVCLQTTNQVNLYYVITGSTNYANRQKVVSQIKSGVTGYGNKIADWTDIYDTHNIEHRTEPVSH